MAKKAFHLGKLLPDIKKERISQPLDVIGKKKTFEEGNSQIAEFDVTWER